MCQHLQSFPPGTSRSTERRACVANSSRSLPRLPPLLVVALLPLLPTWCFINRGFTQWFHWVAVLYLLSRWDFLERFQVLTGISICLGWYSALAYAAVHYGQFCIILYQNMPPSVKDHIFHQGQSEINYDSISAWSMMALAHALDLLGHPLLTYFFWRRHKQNGGTAADIFLSWPVILSSYFFSRLWSMTHLVYNFGRSGIFYIGPDIYIMEHMDCWIPAYVAESAFYALLVAYKLFGESSFHRGLQTFKAPPLNALGQRMGDSCPPKLVYSESGVSRSDSSDSFILGGKRESLLRGTD